MSRIESSQIDKVIDVASQLFASHGFDGVGIREIAAKSGLKPSTIIYHFGSKKSLYQEVIDHKYESAQALICQAMEKFSEPKDRLEVMLEQVHDLLLKDSVMMLIVQRDMVDAVSLKDEHRFYFEYSRYFILVQRCLESALGDDYSEELAFSLLSLLLGHCELSAALMLEYPEDQQEEYQHRQRNLLINAGLRLCLMEAIK